MAVTSAQLDPWRVVCGVLFDSGDSNEIPTIIEKSGLIVSWSLTEKQDVSTNTRKKAWRPCVHAAYDSLNEDDRLRVAFIVASQMLARPTMRDELERRLAEIGWGIQSGRLTPVSKEVTELFFPQQTQHEAYVRLREIIARATRSLAVIDPYVDSSIFTLLAVIPAKPINVDLLTYKAPVDFSEEAAKFRFQYSHCTINIRRSSEFHDRFMVLDGQECWHVGCSIKDAGNKSFMLSKIEDEGNRRALLAQLQASWAGGTQTT